MQVTLRLPRLFVTNTSLPLMSIPVFIVRFKTLATFVDITAILITPFILFSLNIYDAYNYLCGVFNIIYIST